MAYIKSLKDLRVLENCYDIYNHTYISCDGSTLISHDEYNSHERNLEYILIHGPSTLMNDVITKNKYLDIILIENRPEYSRPPDAYLNIDNILNLQDHDNFSSGKIRIHPDVVKEVYEDMSMKKLLDDVASVSKRKEKEELLKYYYEHKDPSLLYEVFRLALDPYIQFNIKQIPEYSSSSNIDITLDVALNMIRRSLVQEGVRGNEAKELLGRILSELNKDDAIVLERVIKKDLRCGVAGKTINKVIGGEVVREYPCMLGKPYDDKSIGNIKWPAYSQSKADGVRVNIHINEENPPTCFSRAGRPMKGVGEFFEGKFNIIRKLLNNHNYVLDGELLVLDNYGEVLDRKTGNGIINKAIKGTAKENEISRFYFVLWDIIPREDFMSKKTTSFPYHRRLSILEGVIEELSNKVDDCNISIIDNRLVNNFKEAEKHFEECLSEGKEGTVLKNVKSEWVGKRCNDLVKFKAELDCDLEITGWNEGKGRFKGMIGSLICESKDRSLLVNISGFSDNFREELSNNIEQYVGKIATVQYNEIIKSKVDDSKYSLFLPRFVEVREDKTEADLTKNIK